MEELHHADALGTVAERIRRIATLLAWFLLAFVLVSRLAALGLLIRLDHNLTYPENASIWNAWHVAHGESAYSDWRKWPHEFAAYGPLLYYPVGWIVRMLGSGDSPMSIAAVGRCASLLWLVGLVGAAILFARRIGLPWRMSVTLVPASFCLWPSLLRYVISFRPDSAAVFFSLVAVLIASARTLATKRSAPLAILCLGAALAFKPSAWAAPIVVGCIYLRSSGARHTLFVVGIVVAAFGLAAFLFDVATVGMFFHNVVGGSQNGYSFSAVREVFSKSGAFAVSVGCAALSISGLLLGKYDGNETLRMISAYAGVALVIAVAQTGKYGADINYLLEPFALSCVLFPSIAAVLYNRATTRPASARFAFAAPTIFATIACCILLAVLPGTLREIQSTRDMHRLRSTSALVAELRGDALIMDEAFLNPDPRTRGIPDPFHYAIMTNRGKTSASDLKRRLEERRLAPVIISRVARTAFETVAHDAWPIRTLERNYIRRPHPALEIWDPLPVGTVNSVE